MRGLAVTINGNPFLWLMPFKRGLPPSWAAFPVPRPHRPPPHSACELGPVTLSTEQAPSPPAVGQVRGQVRGYPGPGLGCGRRQ